MQLAQRSVWSDGQWACLVTVSVASSVQCGFGLGSFNNLDVLVPAGLAEEQLWLTRRQWALIVSGFGLGGFAGALVGTQLLRSRFKAALLLSSVLAFASSTVVMLCNRWDQLMLGRVLLGVSAGISTSVFPLYYAAVTPPGVRAAVGASHRLGLVAGIVASQALTTPSLSPLATLTLWRYVLLVPMGCAVVGLGVLPGCPEDPRAVRASRGSAAALELLAQLHGVQDAAAHLDAMRAEDPEADGTGSLTVLELLASKRLRPKLGPALVAALSIQLSGVDVVLYYSSLVLRHVGLAEPQLISTCLGAAHAAATAVGMLLSPRLPRRPLLLGSWAALACCLAGLAVSVWVCDRTRVGPTDLEEVPQSADPWPELAVAALAGVVLAGAVGPGAIGWSIVAERMPMYSKDAAMALAVLLCWAANGAVAFAFPLLRHAMGPWVFAGMGAACLAFAAFTHNCVPERDKGRPAW